MKFVTRNLICFSRMDLSQVCNHAARELQHLHELITSCRHLTRKHKNKLPSALMITSPAQGFALDAHWISQPRPAALSSVMIFLATATDPNRHSWRRHRSRARGGDIRLHRPRHWAPNYRCGFHGDRSCRLTRRCHTGHRLECGGRRWKRPCTKRQHILSELSSGHDNQTREHHPKAPIHSTLRLIHGL